MKKLDIAIALMLAFVCGLAVGTNVIHGNYLTALLIIAGNIWLARSLIKKRAVNTP